MKDLKQILIGGILVLAVVTAIVYAGFCFVLYKPNPAKWVQEMRGLFIFILLILYAFSFGAMIDYLSFRKKQK